MRSGRFKKDSPGRGICTGGDTASNFGLGNVGVESSCIGFGGRILLCAVTGGGGGSGSGAIS